MLSPFGINMMRLTRPILSTEQCVVQSTDHFGIMYTRSNEATRQLYIYIGPGHNVASRWLYSARGFESLRARQGLHVGLSPSNSKIGCPVGTAEKFRYCLS